MIISASRRTDIPAFYAEMFLNAFQKGYIDVPNPLFPQKKYTVSLKPEDVTAFVFWTRYSQPFHRVLHRLNEASIPYYFLFTITNYGPPLELNNPTLEKQIHSFKELSTLTSSDQVVWRYDPVILSNHTRYDYHLEKFESLAEQLKNYTHTVIISFLDLYKKLMNPFRTLSKLGWFIEQPEIHSAEFLNFIEKIKYIGTQANLQIQTCADSQIPHHLISPGACIDTKRLERICGIKIPHVKDKSQRKLCQCHISRDIGIYNTCKMGCRYCYACYF